jgi:hypothetical protein
MIREGNLFLSLTVLPQAVELRSNGVKDNNLPV